MQFVMDTIRNEGPKWAIDFENEAKKPGSWWNWKPRDLGQMIVDLLKMNPNVLPSKVEVRPTKTK